jgi:hypothetical protein
VITQYQNFATHALDWKVTKEDSKKAHDGTEAREKLRHNYVTSFYSTWIYVVLFEGI